MKNKLKIQAQEIEQLTPLGLEKRLVHSLQNDQRGKLRMVQALLGREAQSSDLVEALKAVFNPVIDVPCSDACGFDQDVIKGLYLLKGEVVQHLVTLYRLNVQLINPSDRAGLGGLMKRLLA